MSLRRVAAGILLLVVAPLLAAELAVRALGLAPRIPSQYRWYVEDPVLPYRLQPSLELEGRSASDEFDFHYVHNRLGFRDRELPAAKPDGAFRVLGLGDSFTYGIGVPFEETFLARLEADLQQRTGGQPAVRVVKAGVPRYFPEAERLLLEVDGPSLDPDLVLVFFVPNDVVDTHMGIDALQVLPDGRLVSNYGRRLLAELGPWPLFVYERVHTARIVMSRFLQARIQDQHPVKWSEVFVADGFHEEAWQRVEAEYDRMVGWARARGASIAFVHLPLMGPWEERHRYPATRLGAWAARAGVPFIDTLPALAEAEGPLYWPIDRHPNARAHAVIARTLADELARAALAP